MSANTFTEALESRLFLSASSSGVFGAAVAADRLQIQVGLHVPTAPVTHPALHVTRAHASRHAATSAVGVTLAIPPRAQWNENNGYCGETTIQAFSLYYGTYASQYAIRTMIDPTQQQDLLVGVDENVALGNLHLTFQRWNYQGRPTPQYQSYLAWTKRQLAAGHPVIGTAYISGLTDPDYDHILPFVGFQSNHGSSGYYANDTLIFHDNFVANPFTRPFSTLAATRAQADQGSLNYYIPRQVDYGCAVTGIVDPHHETVPVRLSVDRWDEPDLIAGQQPVTMNGTVTIRSLVPGKKYTLLRYDNYKNVPSANFLARGGYTSTWTFTAKSSTQTFTDSFMSNACVIYRCVKAARTA